MDYILSYDVGTSALKAILVNKNGEIRQSAQECYEVNLMQDGYVEMDPAEWWAAVVKTTKSIMAGCDVLPDEIKGMVFCTQALNVISMGQDGKILRPAISWLDSRADEEAREIVELIGGPEACEAVMGTVFSGMDSLPKVRWLMKNEPKTFEKMKCFLDCNGYLTYRASGEMVYDISSASFLGYDRESGSIIPELIGTSGFDPEKFPRIVKSFERVGNLTAVAAEELGISTDTAVFGGTCDIQGTTIGSGMAGNEEAHIYLGTSGWAAAGTDKVAVLSNGGGCIMSADPSMQLWVYSTETCCATYNWFIDNFFTAEKESKLIPNIFAFLDHLVEQIPPGSSGLIFNPWISGERSPIQDVFVRGGFLNIGMLHTKNHMLRAVMEGIAYNLKWCYESMENDLGHKTPAVRILGGGTRSHTWMQIFADIFNRKIEVVQDTQVAGAIGGAFVAALGLGMYNSFEDAKQWARVSQIYVPDPKNAGLYAEGFENFKQSYDELKGFYKKINKKK
ncbi:xylulokinase [Sinanaerobacter chloroacetimidivorans]|uniref:FGGY-family carbohydrate kinase n=1 Tax=Sinanaerobacter chloroacetimidivorans TaxID=2818044 RepID=A0A8J8B528_9FIRM|nr:FGGY-family carbohydrate kinase [Sinanaerobacter chloroacetimidivorans]MBR0599935.1 FGGY-family carbohydrate kinase [Sinanaerobacter chloroacetimidivorans]